MLAGYYVILAKIIVFFGPLLPQKPQSNYVYHVIQPSCYILEWASHDKLIIGY